MKSMMMMTMMSFSNAKNTIDKSVLKISVRDAKEVKSSCKWISEMQNHTWPIYLQSVIFGQIPTPVTWVSILIPTTQKKYLFVKSKSWFCLGWSLPGSCIYLYHRSWQALGRKVGNCFDDEWWHYLPQIRAVITYICIGVYYYLVNEQKKAAKK